MISLTRLLKNAHPLTFFYSVALDESVKIVESLGGWCRGQIVDISRREEVYKAALDIKESFGEVSTLSVIA